MSQCRESQLEQAPMQPNVCYKIAKEFSRTVGGRKRANGTFSGEEFREDVARRLLEQYDHVLFDLSGSAGYSSGFLDEAFGGLVKYYSLRDLEARLKLVADDDPGAVDTAWERIRDAAKERLH